MKTDKNKYDDIINRPRHVSGKRGHMAIIDRAAQFAPFAALTGHQKAIDETARLTAKRIDLDETAKNILDAKIQMLQEIKDVDLEIEVLFFKADLKKTGGEYVSKQGVFQKIKEFEKLLVLEGKIEILIKDIVDIKGEIFENIEGLI